MGLLDLSMARRHSMAGGVSRRLLGDDESRAQERRGKRAQDERKSSSQASGERERRRVGDVENEKRKHFLISNKRSTDGFNDL